MKPSNSPFKYLKATPLSSQHQQPHSIDFDDIYFNQENGVAETKHVFINGNDLINHWQKNREMDDFVVAETGFGTGLNLLVLLHQWHLAKDKPKHLHFISVEKHPLSFDDIQKTHQAFPELHPFSQQLLSIWHRFDDHFPCGIQRFDLNEQVSLTLAFGDATENFKQLHATVDAWFLDGFAPKKNPDMWHDELITEINRLSRPGSTLATFTAAGDIRRRLEAHGFVIKKVPGFGKKREMITAVFDHKTKLQKAGHRWYPLPSMLSDNEQTDNKRITILGAGIAGLCLAYYFKQAGFHTTVIEQNAQPMQQASGNALAMVMPVITAQNSPETQFYQRAFAHAQRFYTQQEFNAIGVEQLITDEKTKLWVQAINKAQPPTQVLTINQQKLTALHPNAGYLDTQKIAGRLSQSVDQLITQKISRITQDQSGHWQLYAGNEIIATTELLIIANGIQAQMIAQSHGFDLGLTAKHGMTSVIKASAIDMPHIMLSSGYLIPDAANNRWVCGATFDHLPAAQWDDDAELAADHWQRNKQFWQGHAIAGVLESAEVIAGHAAIRATTADHLPLCGPIVDQAQFQADYHDLHHGRHWQDYPEAKVKKNLYVLNGLGSRGFTSAPLLAQHLCAMICAQPLPLEDDLCKIIHPNRFLYRSLKKPPK
ncbi:bifunctional tRNA (5-methylaminomethyl-2-thiouridine)(34)-methyltransferase MnmD/FAD-dependent 5-carboxymethylaminomethyl-2-thiouridine(34) oxidoreductase MnmC [Marinicella sp. S1101]|uniref:bifunctional tRNA (5-methylaminomethyl-2-thiouridine)(34)-methyltransferase MnmD/FAD-dependent 5-carboxymethylaminomethyl-2-thiouridine(34) oxidoreductase MnmC n=1 Tax=Marinicella marina TaxID=2996016 RepID=UPI00226099AE|nr:bifunctional tRNA (5-methylaminomethyl-2-thiouridine)(34)-methyltransferase MnmD/FAD-dependent 5-carboxymethylaminomethyl-2-thiouridine(34) oxidoreductase MnmC [Marinicella marina]MCX7553049.1 bifunctional tRNA (5-methylaminomethyl-2-thiouridine)(34)-methyltransferase MnmD/FAD-dependent 5-carboxymethylaminomethyl-2-thiouridine(34) oxidoreductase MnmC [Marinicella marina]MDJ1139591.1 bifunctional tRNA (5-methylaminomethyl-2-thiouridine)(34)-methyltransferase MnmD/FAD-dependent 5-carboxymethylam